MADTEVISVQVRSPRTHIKHRWSSYTDYEIAVSTSSMAFALSQSCVRRRFSEFEWLKRTLAKNNSITTKPPSLPNKKVLGRFNQDFLEKRRALLEEFLLRVVHITTYLSEAALHLFLQSNLTVKEIERVLEGKDRRDVTELIANELGERLKRKGSGNTNTDSGFSGSNNLDRHLLNCILQCQGFGNGWSSGCSNSSMSLHKKRGHVLRNGPCLGCRRKSLQCGAASVLPTGQLIVSDSSTRLALNETGSASSSERCPEENCTKCNQYDADDETDTSVIDYDVINARKFRVKNWLSAVTPFSDAESATSEDVEYFSVKEHRPVPEYDILSVPCSSSSVLSRTMSSRSTGCLSDDDTCENDSDYSEYSVVHSTIGGLELENSNVSSSTLSSAGIYRTYDVVEMIEVK